jgi:uncharacterized tellurite resistance protein B-like protein
LFGFSAMLDRLRALILDPTAAPRGGDLQLAVAALLVEAARMDDVFDEAERRTILRLLAGRFGLDAAAAGQLLRAAEQAESQAAGAYRFAKSVVEAMPRTERIGLIEMMWEVVYADGTLDADEDALLRRIAGLVDVDDHERGAARQRVLARLTPTDRA